jgi:RNA polymerase sigma-70 factor (ECF subfamily)
MSVESQLMIIFHQMKGVEETELIQRLKTGDEVAFRTIVETWKDMVYNTVLSILQDPTEAEDITQDVFIQVFESIGQFKGDSKFSTWLYRIAVTKSLDQLRRKKRKKRFAFLQSLFGVNEEEVRHDPGFFHPGVALENKERSAELFKAINKLPENQKTAFLLHKVEGLSYQEVADVMETTVPSVESLMHRAKGNLRKSLAGFYENKG